ncbi:hypothetical protein T484DRAFT_3640043 [Baffinella frigidus]|nr:hypothetical protein T484DRAFT_3640043 [Cryptophyta sp. CCMP2293]
MRFTVFSNDANVSVSNVGGNNRPRKFEWNLNVGSVVKYIKKAIESIFCRNTRAVIETSGNGFVKDCVTINKGDKNGNIYEKYAIYKTSAYEGSDGVGLTVQNRRKTNDGGHFSMVPVVMARGTGYKIGDLVNILSSDDETPISPDLAILAITSINDNAFDHDLTAYDDNSDEQFIRMIAVGNTDEKELFSIRSPSFGNHFDTRDKTFLNAGNIIYMGALKLQNTNPQNAYSYDLKSTDFLNGSFELSVDSNYLNENGISPDIVFGVTFVLLE